MRDLMNLLIDFELEVEGFNHSLQLSVPFNRSELHRSNVYHLIYHVQFYPQDNDKLPVHALRRTMTLTDVDLVPVKVKHDTIVRHMICEIERANTEAYITMMENGGEGA